MVPRDRGRPTSGEYLSTSEAARIMKAAGHPVSPRTIARMIDDGRLRGTMRGTHRRVLRSVVDDFLASQLDTGRNEV